MSASASSASPTTTAELAKFRPRTLVFPRSPRAAVPTAEALTGQLPPSRPASRAAAPLVRYAVPPLAALALEALVAGFEARPSLRGIPARHAALLAQRLSVHLDPRLTVAAVHDDLYWRRVCEGRGWMRGKVELAEHGFSWKQAFCELFVAQELSQLGGDADALPVGYEDEFCRPPIDSTHPRWQELYRRVAPLRLDGRPNRERFAASAADETEIDLRILAAGDCGWPHLERLKALVKYNQANYEASFAWASLDKKAHLDGCAAAEAKAEEARKVAAAAAAGTLPPPSADAAAAAGGAAPIPMPPSLLAVPYLVAAARERDEALRAAHRAEDAFDCAIEGAALREFVLPEALASWKSSTAWPPAQQRGDSVLTTRAKELQTLLDRVQACEDHVFRLVLHELPSHLDLELITSRLPNLTALELQYAPRRLGMRLDSKQTLGMQPADAESLSQCLKAPDSLLTSLSLPCNGIDDGLLAVLMQGLLVNRTVTHLDLSHNLIGNVGMQLLARMLRGGSGACVISSLRLADNRAGARAAEALGAALRRPDCALVHLDLRMNALGDAGGAALLEGLFAGGGLATLASLNLGNCGLGPAAAAAAARVLGAPGSVLTACDLSANDIPEAGAAAIAAAAASSTTLVSLDLRMNSAVSAATLEAASRVVYANEVRNRGGPTAPLLGVYKAVL